MENLSYLFAAYTVVWVALCGYMYTIDAKQRRLQQELESLAGRLNVKHD